MSARKYIAVIFIFILGMPLLAYSESSRHYDFVWKPTPKHLQFSFPGEALENNWHVLGAMADQPWPSAESIQGEFEAMPLANNAVNQFNGDYDAYAVKVQHAWRLLFEGKFRESRDLGVTLGYAGYAPAVMAQLMYATHVEDDKENKSTLFIQMIDEASKVLKADPANVDARFIIAYSKLRAIEFLSQIKQLKSGYLPESIGLIYEILALQPSDPRGLALKGGLTAQIVARVPGILAKGVFGMEPSHVDDLFAKAIVNTKGFKGEMEYQYGVALLALDDDDYRDKAVAMIRTMANKKPTNALDGLSIIAAKKTYREATKKGWVF